MMQVQIFILVFLVHQTVCLRDAKPDENGGIEWTALGKGGKKLFKKRLSQPDAMAHCEKQSKPGRLAVMLTLDDAQELVDDLYAKSEKPKAGQDPAEAEPDFDLGLSRRYWIGLTDIIHEGTWLWMKDGSELAYDEMWTGGQPDHYAGGEDKNEHCVVLWNPNFLNKTDLFIPKHTFNDENCEHQHYFICEDVPLDANKPPDLSKSGSPKRSTSSADANTAANLEDDTPQTSIHEDDNDVNAEAEIIESLGGGDQIAIQFEV